MYSPFERFKYRFALPILSNTVNTLFGKRGRQIKGEINACFIFGSGRNGSTLLATLLNQSNETCFGPEQYVLPKAISYWELYRWKKPKEIALQIGELLKNPAYSSGWKLCENYQSKIEEIEIDSFLSIYKETFCEYQKEKEKIVRYFGDHSPLMTHYFDSISRVFGQGKFIFLVRDPRDVLYSYSKLESHPVAQNINVGIWKWSDSIKMYERAIMKFPEQTLLVKYEEFVSNPEEQLKKITSFLNIHFNESFLQTSGGYSKMPDAQLAHHKNISKPINASSIGKWKGNLSKETEELIKKRLGEKMKQYGYPI